MELDQDQHAAVELAGSVKERLVALATSPHFERQLRQFADEIPANHPNSQDPGVAAVEKLLFGFRYDDGTSPVDRFVRDPDFSEAERAMARGFLQGVDGFFEVLAHTPTGAGAIKVRCCLSDLEHVVVPTEPAGVPKLARGSFLAGRMNPVAGTDLWTPSGALEVRPASERNAVGDAVLQMATQHPWLTHRNPANLQRATELSAAAHERFVTRHGSDLILVAGKDLPQMYAEAVMPAAHPDAEAAASSRAMVRQSIEESELADADEVLVYSHPVAGFGFYLGFAAVARALEQGTQGDPTDVERLRSYLDDPTIPSWLLLRIVTDRLPAAETALAHALEQPDFGWDRDGEQLLASIPGEHEPTVTLAIIPSLCRT